MHYNFEISRGNSSIFEISRGKSSNINHFFFSVNVALVNVPLGKHNPLGQVYPLGQTRPLRPWQDTCKPAELVHAGQTYRTGKNTDPICAFQLGWLV
jgi:hypothetical protein